MQFGIFYEHQLPRPWADDDEVRLYREALNQIELADELGFDYVWEVEHHFLEEYSHSSAPGVFLSAAAQRTEQIRLGHGVRLTPPPYNHPARVAEQLATLDLVSEGRVEWGTGESASRTELEGFGVDPDEKQPMWREATEQIANMLTMEPHPGYEGEYFEMPARNVVPKPVQDPHPPMWVAASARETIEEAARNGVGALCFSFTDGDEAREWVDLYYETFEEECVPIGHSVNPNIAMTLGFGCDEDGDLARERSGEGFAFFQYALGYYYAFGQHEPGNSSVWEQFQRAGGEELFRDQIESSAIGSPEEIREVLREYEEAGVDQIMFVQQGGRTTHEAICDSLTLFADEVMPEFRERHEKRQREKRRRLEPAIEAAMERKDAMDPLAADEIETVPAYGRALGNYGDD